jgi:hypothetical protein
LQVLEHPRHITEQEDVHLIETFLISTKPNKAGWRATKHDNIQDWVGTDFVMIPEKIFDLSQKQPGHMAEGSYEDEMAEIRQHSHGKITKVKGPFPYNDGTDDYYYNAIVKLSGSKSAAALVEHGDKTWTKFAVSPTILPTEGNDDNITKYKPMGLFLVIEGAYGDNAVVEKMCRGSALKCGTSLSAAIHQLNHDTSDEHLSEILTSYISVIDTKNVMSATQEVVQPVQSYQKPIQPELVQPVSQPVELKKDESITLTKKEYDELNQKITDESDLKAQVEQLRKERNESILNQVFGSIEDQEVKNKVLESYADIKDARIVKQVYDHINTHILPKVVEAKLAESKNVKVESKSASVLKPEPKIDKKESVSASIVTDDISLSECRSILGL